MIDTSNLPIAADNLLKKQVAREKIEDLQGNLFCYTDASKTRDNKAGIGIYIPKKQVNISSGGQSLKILVARRQKATHINDRWHRQCVWKDYKHSLILA